MKHLLLIALTTVSVSADIDNAYAERMVDILYICEGGAKARVPYGILSVPVKSAAEARAVCKRTVVNTYKRWELSGKPGEFHVFLCLRYCPPQSDPIGHSNLVRNVGYYLKKNKL